MRGIAEGDRQHKPQRLASPTREACLVDSHTIALQVWAHVFDHVMCAGLVFQIVMLGLMGLKGGLLQSLLLLPLLCLWLYLWSSANDLFRRPLKQLSLHAAAEMDAQMPAVSWSEPCGSALCARFYWSISRCRHMPRDAYSVQKVILSLCVRLTSKGSAFTLAEMWSTWPSRLDAIASCPFIIIELV